MCCKFLVLHSRDAVGIDEFRTFLRGTRGDADAGPATACRASCHETRDPGPHGQPGRVRTTTHCRGNDRWGRAANRRGHHPEGKKQCAHTGTHFTTSGSLPCNPGSQHRMVEIAPKVDGHAGHVTKLVSDASYCTEVPVPIEEPILSLNALASRLFTATGVQTGPFAASLSTAPALGLSRRGRR